MDWKVMSIKGLSRLSIYLLSLLFLMAAFPLFASADVIIFKNGTKLTVDSAWEEGGEVKARLYGGVVGYPAENVRKIERKTATVHQPGSGFRFDKWVSGMNIEEAMEVAETNDIPLHRAGLISASSHFNPKISRDYALTATEFCYKEKSLGKWATVSLAFTPASKRLWSVTISWEGPGISEKSEFCSEVISVIREKYGESKTSNRSLFSNIRSWRINSISNVLMKVGFGSIKLEYVDNQMRRLKQQEDASIRLRLKDKSKF